VVKGYFSHHDPPFCICGLSLIGQTNGIVVGIGADPILADWAIVLKLTVRIFFKMITAILSIYKKRDKYGKALRFSKTRDR
jgi:hypothetical protein